jgi:hypothetical protein
METTIHAKTIEFLQNSKCRLLDFPARCVSHLLACLGHCVETTIHADESTRMAENGGSHCLHAPDTMKYPLFCNLLDANANADVSSMLILMLMSLDADANAAANANTCSLATACLS